MAGGGGGSGRSLLGVVLGRWVGMFPLLLTVLKGLGFRVIIT